MADIYEKPKLVVYLFEEDVVRTSSQGDVFNDWEDPAIKGNN